MRKPYTFFLVLSLVTSLYSVAQEISNAYYWDAIEMIDTEFGGSKTILQSSSRDYSMILVKGISLLPGKMGPIFSEGVEGVILLKSGTVLVAIPGEEKLLGKGSAALILPGDLVSVHNLGEEAAEYFMLEYLAKDDPKIRGSEEGSLLISWEEPVFHPHGKGGVRRYFDRATAMSSRFEMHSTTLNPGLKSHEPHTHRAAEIILMIDGETEEQIGDAFYQGGPGDFYFLESEVSHAIENIGTTPATYYAFQFE